MKELFVPYEIALQLKQKGFNKPCLAVYRDNDLYFNKLLSGYASDKDELTTNSRCDLYTINKERPHYWKTAPLIQQVVDWLKEKHKIYIYEVPYPYEDRTEYHITFKDESGGWCDVDVRDIDEAIKQALSTIKTIK